MTKPSAILIVAAALTVGLAPPLGHAAPAKAPPARAASAKKTGHVEINGVNYYYEIRGKGEPLLLLHGGLGSIDMLGPNLDFLAAHRHVIAVDLHGHGRTTLGDRPISPIDMGDDLAILLEKVGHPQVDVLGYSMGGAVALRLAIQHPSAVRRLALVSAGFAQEGFYPEMLPMQAQVGAAMAEQMKETPMYKTYMAVAPNPSDFPRLLDRMGEWMRKPYNWAEEVRTLTMPVLLIYGDSDMIRLEHAVEFYHLLGGGLKDAGWQREHMSKNRLAILPDLTHYEIFAAPALGRTALPFLDGRSGAQSWGDLVQRTK
ncbi:MAG TPA: alpha/beta fold hydrolase [Candidatus Eisenbacteria bacterium]|nr:alpha/beta fold hydrolase [Candidatus Eisenbacteria bacterium]